MTHSVVANLILMGIIRFSFRMIEWDVFIIVLIFSVFFIMKVDSIKIFI